jgi:tight adherence protein C
VVPVSAAQLGWALLFGATLGLGLWTIVAATPRLSRPRLADRLAPQLVDISPEARRLMARRSSDPSAVVGAFGRPLLTRARRALDSVLGGRSRLEQQLRRAGSSLSVEQYRSQQLIALLVGAAAGGGLIAIASTGSGLQLIGVVILPVTGAVSGIVIRDRLLTNAANARVRRIAQELPTMLEFLSLSLAAGEGIQDALRRISRVGSGELAKEFRGVVAETASGVPLATSLVRFSSALAVPSLSRALDHLVAALERGAPLADVLRAQAQDCRDLSKRDLLELAGKKEVAMLIPLVFFILPFTIAVAVFPGLVALQLGN